MCAVKHTLTPALPDLRIVPVDSVLPHEEHDPQRSEPLVRRIRDAGVWLNPPIVALIQHDLPEYQAEQRYVLLDGANRYHSLKQLDIPHILVQVVDYASKDVALETWNHVLSRIEVRDLLPALHKLDGLGIASSDRAAAEAALANGQAIAYLRLLPEDILLITAESNDFRTRTTKLRELVNTYQHIAKIDRINGDDPAVIRQLYPDAAAVVVFPQYTPDEIIMAARDHIHLPPGISRHIIQGRAMRLHYPLEALRDLKTPLTEKNDALKKWLQERVAQKNLRLYAEAMYIFDD